MNRPMCRTLVPILAGWVLALVPSGAEAQPANDFERLFASYAGANASGYLAPLAEVVGGSLNSGFVRPVARLGREGFHFRLDLQFAAAFVGEGQKEFQATTEGAFEPLTTTSAPTIAGAGTGKVVQGHGGTSYAFPAGLAIERVILPIPQMTVGNVAGTEASVRWFGIGVGDVGDFSLLGFGARHDLTRYLPELPVELAVGAYRHTVSLGDNLDLSSLLISVQASRGTGRASVYGGLGFETSSMEITYTPDDPEQGETRIDVDGASGVRATAGLAFRIPGVTLFGDLTLGSQTVATFGLGLGN